MTNLHHRISLVVTIAVVCLVGCSVDSNEGTPVQDQLACQDSPDPSWRSLYLDLGRETYASSCASCHDENEDDVPIKGDRDSWSGRSPLWSAVLLKHAKSGYLDMPAKGGRVELSDRAVEAAGEYMLSETFPEQPRD